MCNYDKYVLLFFGRFCKKQQIRTLLFYFLEEIIMRIIIDTDKGIFIVPKTFSETIKKQNEILKKAGVSEDL